MKKHAYESETEQVQIIFPQDINGYNRVFGGRLVEWIDILAAVVARRHCCCNVTTASIENLQFRAPAYVNNTIVLHGKITYVSRTSMEVRVDTYVEALRGDRTLINRAYLVVVALDENEKPTAVPELIADTEEEKAELAAGKIRYEERKARRNKS